MAINKDTAQQAYDRWARNKTGENMSALLKELEPITRSASATHGLTRDENVAWAARAYLANQLMERYDPTKSSLSTFAYQVLQRLPRIAAQQKNAVPVPEASDRDLRYLRGVEEDLIDVLGRAPSPAEIADRAGLDISRVKSLRDRYAKPILPSSYLQQLAGTGIPGTSDQSEESPDEELWREYAIDALDETDKKIYQWLNAPKPLSKVQIATKLGISPSAVTQRSTRIGKDLGAYS